MKISSSEELKGGKSDILVLAPSGKGKTHFLGTVADVEKLFIISAERGLKSIADKKFDFTEVNSWAEFIDALKWFMANYKAKKFTALGIDSITRLNLLHSMDLKNETEKLDFDDYRILLASGIKVINSLTKSVPVTVIVTALADKQTNKNTGETKITALTIGQLGSYINSYFDVVAIAKSGKDEAGNAKYWHQISADAECDGRTRLVGLKGKTNVAANYKIYKSN
jgi:hypothetical protein